MARNPIVATPTPEALRTFFRQQRPQPLADAAALLGWSPGQVRHRATSDGVPLRGGLVPWPHVASWIFETWTYEWVVLTLGPDAELLPAGLRAVPVIWLAPAWVIHGLNVQRQVEALPHRTVRPTTLSEYLTDFLARGIDPHTVELLHGDREFMRAFEFPYGGGGG
jgi:hypothetical protein